MEKLLPAKDSRPPLVALCLFVALAAARADDWRRLECDPSASLGSFSCAALACHGGGELSRRTSGGEVERWRNSDPHANAGGLIESEAFEQILLRLKIVSQVGGEKSPGKRRETLAKDDADPKVREHAAAQLNECLACHNPMNAPTSWTPEQIPAADVVNVDSISDGFAIGCETCHGPAKRWIGDHYRRDFNREQFGFHDLKDPLIRARTCTQCHIGDDHRDMNHDMIAAGHPPLRFDLASYERALPKHWNDGRQRTDVRDYELKLWLAGQLANFDSGLSLFESRHERSSSDVKPEGRTTSPRPEFAEFNCSACHHGLRSATEWSAAGIDSRPTDQPLGTKGWNCSALKTLAGLDRPANAADLPATRKAFRVMVSSELRPLLLPESSVPASLLTEFQLAPNYDQQLQGYALYLATAKSRYDEQLKSGGLPARPAVLEELAALRALLAPRSPGGNEAPQRPDYREIRALFQSAADKLQRE